MIVISMHNMSDITDIFTSKADEKYVPQGLTEKETELVNVGHYVVSRINEKCTEWAGQQINYQGLYNDFLKKFDSIKIDREKEKLFNRLERKLEHYLTNDCETIIGLYEKDITNQMTDHAF